MGVGSEGFGRCFDVGDWVQERAYAMLRMNGVDCSDYGISDAGSYDYEEGAGPCDRGRRGEHRGERLHEDAFDANDPDVDDETFAMALQDSEEQEVAVRLMAVAGLNVCGRMLL